jgi:hypothetical protein
MIFSALVDGNSLAESELLQAIFGPVTVPALRHSFEAYGLKVYGTRTRSSGAPNHISFAATLPASAVIAEQLRENDIVVAYGQLPQSDCFCAARIFTITEQYLNSSISGLGLARNWKAFRELDPLFPILLSSKTEGNAINAGRMIHLARSDDLTGVVDIAFKNTQIALIVDEYEYALIADRVNSPILEVEHCDFKHYCLLYSLEEATDLCTCFTELRRAACVPASELIKVTHDLQKGLSLGVSIKTVSVSLATDLFDSRGFFVLSDDSQLLHEVSVGREVLFWI